MDQPFHILPDMKASCFTSIFERDEDEGELTPLEKMEDVLARDDSNVFCLMVKLIPLMPMLYSVIPTKNRRCTELLFIHLRK